MKKIFTLVAAAMMAAGVNAQTEVWALSSLDVPADLSQEASEQVAAVDMYYGTGFKESKESKYGDGSVYNFITQGNDNPSFADDGFTPAGGVYYMFACTQNGKLEVPISLNANKEFYVVETTNDDGMPALEGNRRLGKEEFTITSVDGVVQTLGTTTDSKGNEIQNSVASKVVGMVAIQAQAGKAYCVFCRGSKLGIYGFQFTASTNGIDNITTAKTVNENAPMFNLAGQRVSKDYKGVVLQEGKKFINK